MEKTLPLTTPPITIVSIMQRETEVVGLNASHAFLRIGEESQIVNSTVTTTNGTRFQSASGIETLQFLKHGSYNMAFRVRDRPQLDAQSQFRGNNPIYSFTLKSNLLSPKILHEQNIKLSMAPYDADMEGIQKSRLSVDCANFVNETCRIHLTYSTRITNLAATPYDTDCKDYRDVCYSRPERTCASSKESCLSDCLHQFTEQHGFVIESNVLWKYIYENSSETILPWYFRTMSKGHNEVNLTLIQEDLRKSIRDDFVWSGLVSNISRIFPAYKDHWKLCSEFCRRPGCKQESLVPKILLVSSIKNSWPKHLDIQVYPSDDQIITVTSTLVNTKSMQLLNLVSLQNSKNGISTGSS